MIWKTILRKTTYYLTILRLPFLKKKDMFLEYEISKNACFAEILTGKSLHGVQNFVFYTKNWWKLVPDTNVRLWRKNIQNYVLPWIKSKEVSHFFFSSLKVYFCCFLMEKEKIHSLTLEYFVKSIYSDLIYKWNSWFHEKKFFSKSRE